MINYKEDAGSITAPVEAIYVFDSLGKVILR